MLDSAFAWLQSITDWLGRFIPRWVVVNTTEGAVKYQSFVFPYTVRKWLCADIPGTFNLFCPVVFEGDIRTSVCKPGMHWYWPVTTEWQDYPTAMQTDRLETQTMETADGVTFLVSGTLSYIVEDLGKLLPVVHNAATLAVDMAMAAVHDVCCEMTWTQLREEQRHATKLKTKLRNSAQDQLSTYGIKVVKLQLNSMARCRVLKVSQSVSQEEN